MIDEKVKILLIEDNKADLRLVKECLKEAEDFIYDLLSTNRLSNALDTISNNNFDILLLDLSLPDSIGLNTLKEITEMIRFEKKNPVVVKEDIPEIDVKLKDDTSVFNPGAIKIDDTYHLMLRVQNRGRRTFFIMASSKNGYDFEVENATLECSSGSDVKAHVTKTLNVKASSGSDVKYRGNPELLDINTSSGSDLNKID